MMDKQGKAFIEYILLVHLPLEYGPAQAAAVREEWNTLLGKWKAASHYITSFVYPNDGYLVSGPEKRITEEAVISGNFKLVSHIIVRA